MFRHQWWRSIWVVTLISVVIAIMAGCDVKVGSSSGADTSNAAQATTDQQTAAPTKTERLDGSGILWKPVSEADGRLVVLLRADMEPVPLIVYAFSNGQALLSGRYVGRTNPDRPTYRFGLAGAALPSPLVLRAGHSFYFLTDPGARHE